MKRRNLTIIAMILFCVCILALTACTAQSSGNNAANNANAADENTVPGNKAEDDTLPHNGIPVVTINIDESKGTIADMLASPDHEVYTYGTLSIDVPEGFHYSDYPDLDLKSYKDLEISLRGRGNSTWHVSEKKPFKIKLDKKEDIFSFGKNKHWVLLANALDPSLIRNRITYRLCETLNFDYTPQGVPVDLVMSGSQYGTRYLGSYLLGENIRVGENRLDIGELEEDDVDMPGISGGYLIQNALQVPEGSPNRFITKRGETWATDTPSFDLIDGGYKNNAQRDYIRNHLNTVEDALFEGGDAYKEFLDVKAAASYWLINTLAGNLDAYKTSSTYIYKVRDTDGTTGKMYWGPIWDYDYAWDQNETYKGMRAGHSWVKPLFTDRSEGGFLEEVKKQWALLRDDARKIAADGGLIDQYYEETKLSAQQDHLLDLDGKNTGAEYSYKEQVEHLKTWIRNRIDWLDENMDSIDAMVHTITYVVDGKVVDRDYCEITESLMLRATAPDKEGFIYKGWEDEDGNIYEFDIETDHDTTLTAKYIDEKDAPLPSDIIFAKSGDAIRFDPENKVYLMQWYVLPADAFFRSVEFTSSDENIASVNEDGEVTILAPGTVTITVTTINKISRDFRLVITEDELPRPEKIAPEQDVIRMKVGEETHIVMHTEPAISRFDEYTYGSENSDIAEVDVLGIVEAISEGTARIHVSANTYTDSGDTISCDTWVTVIVEP